MSVNLQPLEDRILVERVQSESKTPGGLYIPDTAKDKATEGNVIAVGEGKRSDNGQLVPMTVKKGDRVLFGKWSGSEVELNGKEYIVMKESDILGIIK